MERVAQALIDVGAVQIRPDRSFQLASGRRSPVYVDVRRVISFPEPRRDVIQGLVQMTKTAIGLDAFDVVAGGETAGIPFAAWLAWELNRPLVYVRKRPKGHGRTQQIEGQLVENARVLLVEDLVTDGGSKRAFQTGIQNAGGRIDHCLCVFEYFSERAGLAEARVNLDAHGLTLHGLTHWDELLDALRARGALTARAHEAVLAFLADSDEDDPANVAPAPS